DYVINHTRIAQLYVINTHPRARFDRGCDDFAILVHNVARPGENIITRTIRVVRTNNERFERLIISRRAFLSRCFEERPRYRYWFCSSCPLPFTLSPRLRECQRRNQRKGESDNYFLHNASLLDVDG